MFLKKLIKNGKEGNEMVIRNRCCMGILPLGTGTIDGIFQGEGIEPVIIDKLKSLVTEGAMAVAVYFSVIIYRYNYCLALR